MHCKSVHIIHGENFSKFPRDNSITNAPNISADGHWEIEFNLTNKSKYYPMIVGDANLQGDAKINNSLPQ